MLPIGFDLVRPRGCQHERVQVAVGDGNISRPGIVARVQADEPGYLPAYLRRERLVRHISYCHVAQAVPPVHY